MMQIVDNPQYVQAVRSHLIRSHDYVKSVFSKFVAHDIFLWGGAVRDPIYNSIFGTNIKPDDFDLIIDDSVNEVDLNEAFMMELHYGEATFNRFGTIKYKPMDGLEIDVSRFSNANPIRDGIANEISLVTTLMGCDFNTGALAYNPRTNTLYDDGAIAALEKREIDLHYAGDDPAVMMARLIMHSQQMDFSIGLRGQELLETYTPKLDEKIIAYLEGRHKTPEEVLDALKSR